MFLKLKLPKTPKGVSAASRHDDELLQHAHLKLAEAKAVLEQYAHLVQFYEARVNRLTKEISNEQI